MYIFYDQKIERYRKECIRAAKLLRMALDCRQKCVEMRGEDAKMAYTESIDHALRIHENALSEIDNAGIHI